MEAGVDLADPADSSGRPPIPAGPDGSRSALLGPQGPGPHAPPPRGAAWAAGRSGWRTGRPTTEKTMKEMREVKELAIGDAIHVDGFDEPMVVRSAKKIKKGLDAGKLEVALVAPDGEREVMAFAPEERVKVVGKDAE